MSIAKVIALIKMFSPGVDPAVIESAVSDWLDDHPEATTTVEDGSITKAKLDNDLQGAVDEIPEVSAEINSTEEAIEDNTGTEKLQFTYGAYINNDEGVVDITTPTAMDNTAYAVADCEPGDKFTVWGTGLGKGRLWCWINSENGIIDRKMSESEPTVITAPANAVKLIVDVITLYDYGAYRGVLLEKRVTNNENDIAGMASATLSDIGKALSPKTVDNGKVTEWKYVDVDGGYGQNDNLGLTPITDLVIGKYIKTNGTTVDVTSELSNSGMAYKVVSCQAGDVFVLRGTGVSFADVFCFIDSSGNKKTYKQVLSNRTTVIAPYGATKLVLNVSTSYDYEFYKGLPILDRVTNLEVLENKILGTPRILPASLGYIKTNESTVNPNNPISDSNYAYAVIDCNQGDLFTVWGTGASYAYLYCFIDDSGNKYGEEQTVLNPKTIVAPANATKLVLNQITLYDAGFYKGKMFGNALYDAGSQWAGKKVATFGDSITWYDGEPFGNTHSEYGQIAVGYQHYLRELGINIVNKGMSGYRMDQILGVIKASAVSDYDCVTITCGANDFRYPTTEPLGTIEPIGSTFDEGTMIGALQSAIEWLISTKPKLKIFLITPIKGFSGGVVMPDTYPQAFRDVGKLYSLPICDWYDQSGINELNKATYIGDNEASLYYALHPTNAGFKLMGEMLRGFFISH